MTAVDAAAILAAQRSIDPRVIDLARALSLATRIETELVRLMRSALFPQSDAGLEANLWFSPLVAERDTLGIALVAECRDELRRELMLPEHRATLDAAWRVIIRAHQPAGQPGVPPVVAIQEAISYHAIAGTEATAFGHRRQMQLELGTLVRALDDDSDGSLARWMEGALPELPDAARKSPAAITLAEKLRQQASVDVSSIPRAEFDASGRWLSDTSSTIDVGCHRRTDGIEFSIPPAPDSHVLKLPRTSPLVVEIQTPRRNGWQTRQFEFPASGVHLFSDPTPGSRCRITTASGHRVGVQPAYYGGGTPALVTIANRLEGHADTSVEAIRDVGWHPSIESQTASPSLVNACLVIGGRPEVERALTWGVPVLVYTSRGLRPLIDVPVAGIFEHGGPVFSAEYSRDGSHIVTGGDGGTQVWHVPSGHRMQGTHSEQAIRTATFSPDGLQLLTASNDGSLALWPTDGEPERVHAHDGWVMSAEFSTSGRLIVTASQDGTVKFWRRRGAHLQARNLVLAHQAAVNHASFSPDETMVATAAEDRTAGVWRVEDGSRIATLQHESGVDSAVWSPDGKSLLTADFDGNVWIWDPVTGERDPSPFRHDDEVHFATFSRDGRRIAAATASGEVVVWHVASRAVIAQIQHASAPESPDRPAENIGRRRLRPRGALSVAFSPDDTSLLTAGTDGRAVVWDLATGDHRAGGAPLPVIPPDITPKDRLGDRDLEELRAQLLALDDRRLLWWTAAEARRERQQGIEPDVAAVEPPPETTADDGGRHALVAIVADGIDVLHETFLDAAGSSRIVAIWDQRDATGRPPDGFAFGTLHTQEDIARYLDHQLLPPGLDRNVDGAGTHAASIAAGRAAGGFGGSIAPDAAIIAVVTSGDHARYLTDYVGALQFIDGVARRLDRSVVVCIDHGINAGSHDGKSNLEAAFDEFSKHGRATGRVIVVPAGDRGRANGHAQLQLLAGTLQKLRWRCSDGATRTSVELWWPSTVEQRFQLNSPTNDVSPWVDAATPSSSGTLGENSYRIELMRRHVTNGDSQLAIEFWGSQGIWELKVETASDSRDLIHAWIETGQRETRARVEFLPPHVNSMATLVVPATANSVIAVGAVEISANGARKSASFSSAGPTRDNRAKPDLSANGVNVIGARGGTSAGAIAASGTLPAAAHVAGAIAVVLSRARATGGAPTAAQVAAALRQTLMPSGDWHDQQGYGGINVDAFIAAFADRPSA